MHSNFYVSPSSFTYLQYNALIAALKDCGWTPTWVWEQAYFSPDAIINQATQRALFKAMLKSDIFLAMLPGFASTSIEIGAAYILCEKIFLASRDPVYFKQTGPCDAHAAGLPGVEKLWCEAEEIPALLKCEFPYLIETN